MSDSKAHTRALAYGFYPFWFWNDRLSKDEVRRQVNEMAAQGVRGFFIHSRQGLEQPYLSKSFMDMVTVAIEAAEEHDMFVHLYDEYPYPSGVAGGQVVLGKAQYQATRLVQRTYDVAGGSLRLQLPRGDVLSCVAYPLRDGRVDWDEAIDLKEDIGTVLSDFSYFESGLTVYNRKRFFASNPVPVVEAELPKGHYRIFVSVQAVVDNHKYWGHFTDVLNPEAIADFIRLTHERYYSRFGDLFGKRIHSIFVDETAPGWSDCLPQVYRHEYGADLCSLLPALQDADHPEHLAVLRRLRALQYRLFCQSFEEPVADWCRRHNIRYSGEKPSLRLSQLRYMDIPGCEPGHTKAGAPMDLLQPAIRQNARATASAAYFYGKEGALCECYHSLGWGATLQDAKLIAEGLLLHGIRYLVPHGFFYSTHALRKHDAPPTFFFQMPYWRFFGQLARRIEAIGSLFEGTYIDAHILLVDPSPGMPTAEDQKVYAAIQQLLMAKHFEFMIVDTDILESGAIDAGMVTIRNITASVILVPPMRHYEEELLAWLDRFQRAGGQVVYCRGTGVEDRLGALLDGLVAPSVRLTAQEGDVEQIQVVRRTNGSRTVWFFLNTGPQQLELGIETDQAVCERPLEGGLPAMLNGKEGRYVRVVRPFESFLLETVQEEEAASGNEVPDLPLLIPVKDPMKVGLENQNLLRLAEWEMSLLDENGQASQGATVPAAPLANQLEKGRFRFAPQIQQAFGTQASLALPPLRIRYVAKFQNEYDGRVELVMEPGSLISEWTIQVNDTGQLGPADFTSSTAHVRGSLGAEVTSYLKRGENRITVEIRTDRLDGGLVNPLYLAGDFGVNLDPLTLIPRPDTGGFESYVRNGLPYYAGALTYETSFVLDSVPRRCLIRSSRSTGSSPTGPSDCNGEVQQVGPPTGQLSQGDEVLVELALSDTFQEACEVSINHGDWRTLPWSPRLFTVAPEELIIGENSLRIRVHTTLIRSFEGEWFDAAAHCYRQVGEGEK